MFLNEKVIICKILNNSYDYQDTNNFEKGLYNYNL